MKNSLDKMYEELLDMENSSNKGNAEFDDLNGLFIDPDSALYDPDEVDTFVTSKELVKTKNRLEEQFGISTPEEHEIEETVHFKIYGKRHEHVYTESEMNAIRESCVYTIVHDYSDKDFYHMTDEERAETDMLSEIRVKLGTLRRSYSKVDQYIEAMRIVVYAWELLEKKGNFIHSEDEFFQMVSDKRITSNGIIMPKLKRMDRYNVDMLVRYISNPELDPKDLLPQNEENDEYDLNDIFIDIDEIRNDPRIDDYYIEFIEKYKADREANGDPVDDDWDESEVEEEAVSYIREQIEIDTMERLLSPEQAQYIVDYISSPEDMHVKPLKHSWVKDYERKFNPSKNKSKKRERTIIQIVHEMLTKIQNNPKNTPSDETAGYSITNSMFDTDKPEKDFWDDLYFDGSWASKSDTYIYDLAVSEELLKLNPPNESYATYADRHLRSFFRTLEENGVNTVELSRRMKYDKESLNKEENKRTKKQNAKIEAAIIQRIEKLNKSDKFKKLISKAEKQLNDYNDN